MSALLLIVENITEFIWNITVSSCSFFFIYIYLNILTVKNCKKTPSGCMLFMLPFSSIEFIKFWLHSFKFFEKPSLVSSLCNKNLWYFNINHDKICFLEDHDVLSLRKYCIIEKKIPHTRFFSSRLCWEVICVHFNQLLPTKQT